MRAMKEMEDQLYSIKDDYFRSKDDLQNSIEQYDGFKSQPNVDKYVKDKLFQQMNKKL